MKNTGYLPILILLIMLNALHNSCTKTIDPPVVPNDTLKVDSLPYDIIWQTPQNITDSSGSYSPHFVPVIIGDLVLNANDVYGRGDDVDTITAYNKETGKVEWKWSDFQAPTKRAYQNAVHDGVIFITTSEEFIGIDGLTGKTVIRRITPYGLERFSVSNDMIFNADQSSGNLYGDLVLFKERTMKWEQITRIYRKDQFKIFVYPPTVDIQQNLDTLLFFQCRFYDPSKSINGSEMYCYNMTRKEMVWNSMVDSLVSNVNNTPYVDGTRVYFCSAKTVHCFDKFTGKRIWKTHFPNTNFLATNYLMTEDKIVIGSDNGERIAVRKNDGKVVYNIRSYSTSFWRLSQYKNWLLNVDKQLEIYDINTGQKKVILNTRHKKGYFNTGVAVDESTGLFYLPDGYNMMCIKVKGI